MSEAFTEILGAAERAAVGSEADRSALARLLNGIDLARHGRPEDRAYLAVLLDRLGMQEQAMLVLRSSDAEHGDGTARTPNLAGTLASGHGEYERARELFMRALSAAGDDTDMRVKILANLAALRLLAGEVGPASEWLMLGRNARVQAGDPATDVLLASTEFGIAQAQGDIGGMCTAVSRLNEATRARIAELGAGHPLGLTAVASLAAADFELASAQESVEGQDRAIGVLEVTAHRLAADLGADHPQALTCLENMCVADFRLAYASRSLDRASRAASMLEMISRRTTVALGENHPQARAAAANAVSAQLRMEKASMTDRLSVPWGRVDADGTVYVRTADGERVIGSWAAGSPEEALAFYRRKYESLETEVTLIEQRMSATEIAPAQAQATVQRLLGAVADANCIGDLDSLRVRLEALTTAVDQRREEVKAAREHARAEAREIKERIVAEAEHIAAEATHWKASGERMAELLEEWKAAPHTDRAVEAVLWKRLSAARDAFTKRRKSYFASLEAEREQVRLRKEKLVEEAEALEDSTDWGPTTSAYRDLMRQWKEAGRAGRDAEAGLWKRFRDAQDKFFAARTEVFAAKETEFRSHVAVKEQLLAEAQALLPVTDLRAARSTLRSIQERWEQAGPVPRDSREQLESGLRRVEETVRRAEEAQWRKSNPDALARAEGTVNQLRAAITSLEAQVARARDRNDQAAVRTAEEALAARRSWLEEAERTLAEFSS